MADDEKPKPDNVIQFRTMPEPGADTQVADALLQDCVGEYAEVIIVGIDAEGHMTVTTSTSDIGEAYEALMTAATNVAMAAIDEAFGREH
jgi:hypothetical protein